MTDDQSTFGTRLRAARLRAGFQTQAAFADHLSTLGLPYSDEAIGHWENDRRKPADRVVALQLLGALAWRDGFHDLAEVNGMLWLLGWRDVSVEEQAEYFPALARAGLPPNLPPRPYDRLVGRDDLVAALAAHLGDPVARPVVVVSGLGGIGKTALAYEVASRVMAAGHFERLAWTGARSEEFVGVAIRARGEQPINLHSILIDLAQQLGFSGLASLAPEMLQRRLRGAVRQGDCLIVLDNLETLAAARDVARALHALVSPAAGSPPSKVLITSRERLVDEPFVFDQFVRGLSEPDAVALVELEARNRGAGAVLGDDAALGRRIHAVTGGMPLALKLIVSQYLLGIGLGAELARLESATDEEQLYRFIYFSLWEKLSREAQKVLVGAATFGTSAQRGMLMRVSQVEESAFDPAIADLVRASLIEVIPGPGAGQPRYATHAMTRWFVNAPLAEVWHQQKGEVRSRDE